MVILLASVVHVSATTVTLEASKDNTFYESSSGHLSNGRGSHLFAGTTASLAIRRGLIAFDVAASVPAESTIVVAELRLHMSRTIGAAEDVSLHRLTSDWGEGASVGFGEEGGGAPSTPGDATWKHTFHDTGTWVTAGGDFHPDTSASAIVIGTGFYNWGSTTDLVADVQLWLDQPALSFGWLIRGNEDLDGTAKRFDSRNHPDTQVRPVLTIEYVPEPATGGLIGVALGICTCRPRGRWGYAKGDRHEPVRCVSGR